MDTSETVQAAVKTTVLRNEPVCREHCLIETTAATFPLSEPGQFLQLSCVDRETEREAAREWPEGRFPQLAGRDWGPREAYLRRPFSIADQWIDERGETHLVVISRNVGPGTDWLEHLRPGERLDVTGPLGRGFVVPADGGPLVLIGGGVGIPPLLYLARRLHVLGRHDVTVILGALSRDLLPVALVEEPRRDGCATRCVRLPGEAPFQALLTTDDGTCGLRGRVTDGLEAWHRARDTGSAGGTVFACGPDAMLRAVAAATRRAGLACQLCIERNMGCGLGTCLSCVVRRRSAERSEGWAWALTCTDGPVFDRDALLDYAP